jgi:hypothetical protein
VRREPRYGCNWNPFPHPKQKGPIPFWAMLVFTLAAAFAAPLALLAVGPIIWIWWWQDRKQARNLKRRLDQYTVTATEPPSYRQKARL